MAHILVIEDNSTMREGVSQVLETMGHDVYAASNGREGLQYFQIAHPELVITDLKMDDIDQIEIHEAFAATAVAALEEIRIQTNYDWEKKFDEKKINMYGGSIAIGHPFGATGVRLIANGVMDFKNNPDTKRVLLTACAHGGVAGSLMLERYNG